MNAHRSTWSARPRYVGTFLLVFSLQAFLVEAVAAQTVDDGTRAAARALAQAGIEAYLAGDYTGASQKLEKGYRLFVTPTLGLWSARARMQLGQWVEATERYRETLRASVSVGDNAVQEKARQDAAKELDALQARLPGLTITLQGDDATGVTLRVDDVSLSSELFGVRRPTNPGSHRVVVERGHDRDETIVELADGEHKDVALRLPPVTKKRADKPHPPRVATPIAAELTPPTAEANNTLGPQLAAATSTSDRSSPQSLHPAVRPLAITALALGGASIVTSGVSALVAQQECSGGRCFRADDRKTYDAARATSMVSFWAGVALVGSGIATWWLGSDGKPDDDTRLSWTVSPFHVAVKGAL